MIPGKAPGALLEAFSLARRGLPHSTRLVFVGNGPEELYLLKKVDQMGLRKDVFLAGELNGLGGCPRSTFLFFQTCRRHFHM